MQTEDRKTEWVSSNLFINKASGSVGGAQKTGGVEAHAISGGNYSLWKSRQRGGSIMKSCQKQCSLVYYN